MNNDLKDLFLAYTPEEKRLLRGEPLQKETYTDRGAFIVEGKKFVPVRQMIALRPHTRFTDFPMHRHDYVEMMYMISGKTVHEMPDGRTIHLKAGEVLLINRHSAHSIRRCGEEDIAVNFIIQPAFFEIVPELIGTHNVLGNFLLDALRDDEKAVSYLHFQIDEKKTIQLLLQSMVHSFLQQPPVGRLISRTEMALLFLYLLGEPECMALPANVHQENLYVIDLLQEIRLHYDSFSLKAYGHSAGCHRHISAACSRRRPEKPARSYCRNAALKKQRSCCRKRI